MSEGLTSDEYRALHTITVVEEVQPPWGCEPGEVPDRLQLVRDGAGGWGHRVRIEEQEREREDCGDAGIDRDEVIWYCDERSARACMVHEVAESDCDACGLSYVADEGRQSPEGNMVVCPPCWKRGEDTDAREIDAMTDEQVSDELRAAGGDPEAIGERGRQLALALLEKRRAAAPGDLCPCCGDPLVNARAMTDARGNVADLCGTCADEIAEADAEEAESDRRHAWMAP